MYVMHSNQNQCAYDISVARPNNAFKLRAGREIDENLPVTAQLHRLASWNSKMTCSTWIICFLNLAKIHYVAAYHLQVTCVYFCLPYGVKKHILMIFSMETNKVILTNIF